MRLVLVLLLGLTACSGKEGAGPVDSGAEALGPNPVVPEAFELLWDLDAESCDDDGAIVYFRFQGEIDDGGALTGTETWYWFHSGEGWDGDCYDVFDADLEEGALEWSSDPCSGCDREFLGTWTLRDDADDLGCAGYGYEGMFDDDQRDRMDEEVYETDIMLDPLSPSGNVNQDMLVFGYTMDDESEYSWNARPNARGEYVPMGEDYTTGPATLEWTVEAGMCVSFG